MNDAKGPESGIAIAEPEKKVKTLQVGNWFTFFDKPIESDASEIMETADLNDRNGNTMAGVIGTALTFSGKEISADEKLRLMFEIRANKEKEASTVPAYSQGTDTEGFPLASPVMFVKIVDGEETKLYASIGEELNTNNARSISFSQWRQVDDENKNKAARKSVSGHNKPKDSQPLNPTLHQLATANFKIT